MIRVRFKTGPQDYRPAKFPPPHPYWCTGYMGDGAAVIIGYADDIRQVYEYWPDAEDIDTEEVQSYFFSGRFPRPAWFK
jgi:hypothetical protein